ncbi:L-serine ammonia-lyase, iron-sulfur-dependent, subunit alpha [Luteitalea sp. TBR-22]|uniref:L-serine ammonia-lyase, iron-sulfur-dependent, subunit alpha n=1 Tax=Luteitalea sp. TBR-22 TaxID=2802971 RepID=UPI001EF69B1B|nr:L-serine ammonia-lyase, iron-sulfur-dependent, subunit alpha [Luteitalea sp. TBR-22]
MTDERLSIVDMFKIGVGPSSSHTLGPWRAAQQCVAAWGASPGLDGLRRIDVHLFGSLAKTGRGHGTDVAVVAGLIGADPETCEMTEVHGRVTRALAEAAVALPGHDVVALQVHFHTHEVLPQHPNGLRFSGVWSGDTVRERTCFSVGGGFVVWEDDRGQSRETVTLPYPVDTAEDLLRWCGEAGLSVSSVVLANEAAWRPEAETRAFIARIWDVMRACIHRGCHTPGRLPGGLNVRRRAADINTRLMGSTPTGIGPAPGRHPATTDVDAWFAAIRAHGDDFAWTLDWVTAFALAVNEENACFGRVVTAPTNGAAGVVPAVLAYDVVFGPEGGSPDRIARFLLTASEVGCLFKKGATISAAMGGCQAEIGVSSAMAAAGLTEVRGGSPSQVLMAAEIAMEHHLGLTCDPVGGLVQIPCIERNTMGAIKAITASQLALASDPANAKVPLDAVIHAMWTTALDMSAKYKETADGGLAVHIPLSLSEC